MDACVRASMLVLVLVAGGGCKDAARSLLGKIGEVGTPERPPAPELVAPDDDALRAFGTSLVAAADKGDIDALLAMIDWDLLLARAAAGLKLSDAELKAARDGLTQGVKKDGIMSMLLEAEKTGDGVSFLAAKSIATRGERRAVFRLLFADRTFDHLAFVLHQRPDGRVVAVDYKAMTATETQAEVVHHMLVPLQAGEPSEQPARSGNPQDIVAPHQPKLIEMRAFIAKGNVKKAMKIYDALPPEVKTSKAALVVRLAVAQKLDEAAQRAVLEELISRYPDAPDVAFFAIDLYALRGEPDKAIAAVDKLIERAGPDPYFHVLRANSLLMAKNYDAAQAAALQAVTEDPSMSLARWTLVTIGLERKDYREVAHWLGPLIIEGKGSLEALKSAPDFAGFVASEPYNAMLATIPTE